MATDETATTTSPTTTAATTSCTAAANASRSSRPTAARNTTPRATISRMSTSPAPIVGESLAGSTNGSRNCMSAGIHDAGGAGAVQALAVRHVEVVEVRRLEHGDPWSSWDWTGADIDV